MKFKINDIVIKKPYLKLGYSVCRVIGFNEELNKYKVLSFSDVLDPDGGFTWQFIRGEDLELASEYDQFFYNDGLKGPVILNEKNYRHFYTWSLKTLYSVIKGEKPLKEYHRACRKKTAYEPYEDDFKGKEIKAHLYRYEDNIKKD